MLVSPVVVASNAHLPSNGWRLARPATTAAAAHAAHRGGPPLRCEQLEAAAPALRPAQPPLQFSHQHAPGQFASLGADSAEGFDGVEQQALPLRQRLDHRHAHTLPGILSVAADNASFLSSHQVKPARAVRLHMQHICRHCGCLVLLVYMRQAIQMHSRMQRHT